MVSMEVTVRTQLYPKEAVLNACYAFLDRVYIFLDGDADLDRVRIRFRAREGASRKQLTRLKDEFLNELIHASLRMQVSEQSKAIRELIVGKALLAALPAESDKIEAGDIDYKSDPLGIAVPWEKKHKK